MKKTFYHGSSTSGIKVLKPHERYSPKVLGKVGPAIYATDLPCYAASHAFPWSSDEGFDVEVKKGKTILYVPKDKKERLFQKIFLYKISANSFELLKIVEPVGHNFIAYKEIPILNEIEYSSVIEAFNAFDGEIIYI